MDTRTVVCWECDSSFEVEIKHGRPHARCEECRKKNPRGPAETPPTNIRFTEGDKEELRFIQDKLGVTKAEAVRTAIRVYAALLRK